MESVNYKNKNQEAWNEHVLKAQQFGGSNSEYCRVNNLSLSTFFSHKSRLGLSKLTKASRARTAFVKVEPRFSADPGEDAEPKMRNLPDPKWVAKFVLALTDTGIER